MHVAARLREHFASPQYRNGYFLMMNSVVGAATGVAFWLLAARSVEPAALGAAAAAVSAFTLAALLGKLGLDAALVRRVPALGPRGRRAILLLALAVGGGLAAAVALAFALALPSLDPQLAGVVGRDGLAIALFALFAVAIGTGWVFDAYFVAERRAGRSFARNLVFNAVRLLLPIPLLAILPGGLAIAAAWGLGAAVSAVAAALIARGAFAARGARADEDLAAARPGAVLPDAAANYAVNVGEFLPSLALPLIVTAVAGAEANAAFYVAWTLAGLGFLASKAFANSAFAELVATPADGAGVIHRSVRQHATVLVPFALGGILLGPEALALFGPGYGEGSRPLLALLLVSLAFVAVNNLAITVLREENAKPRLVAFPAALMTLVLAFSLVSIPAWGVLGVGVAWLAANAVAAVPAWSIVARRAHRRWTLAALAVGGRPHQE
ncbi:MAG TPA: hypothetical protein VM889_01940 [Candidatus Thermoplasmatota archaeon]|nr:hypothetical protein [Candidatus Thermoplasmatota archaeon]